MNSISRTAGSIQSFITLNFWNADFFLNVFFPFVLNLLPILAILLLTSSCDDAVCERGRGRTEVETYEVSEFDGIEVGGAVDVEIIKSTKHKFEIEAQQNIIDQFRHRIKNNVLYLKSDCYHTSRDPKIRIYCENLNQVSFSGSGKVESDDEFNSEQMDIDLSGSGTINLKGQTNDLFINISGSGRMELEDLSSQNCKIDISGSGKCYVAVEKKLDVKISGSGDVYYTGNPIITQKVSGSGNIRDNN